MSDALTVLNTPLIRLPPSHKVLRDPMHNVGPWDEWADAVVKIEPLPGMYHGDTVVIPGLRDALLAALRQQAAAVCASMVDHATHIITPAAWLALPQHVLSKRLLFVLSAPSHFRCIVFD